MRTKTLLLSAVALAAGLLSSQAQSNVYSANIVGYVTTVIKGNGAYTLIANPLDSGSNNITGLLDAVLPNKSIVLTWDSVGQTYVQAQKTGGTWNTNTPLPVGTGFFVKTPVAQATDITNTFVGNIVVAPNGGTNQVTLPGAYYLAGSVVPFNGNINDYLNGTTNTVNLGGVLPNKSLVLTWDAAGQTYIQAQKTGGTWNTNLALNPGVGFFIKPQFAGTNWVETLSVQ